MISLYNYIFPSQVSVEKLMSVSLMTEQDVFKNKKYLTISATLYFLVLGIVCSAIFDWMEMQWFQRIAMETGLLIAISLIVLIAVLMSMLVVVSLEVMCTVIDGVDGKISKFNVSVNGVKKSACGYAINLNKDVEEYKGTSYKSEVIKQCREFTRLDLWALENIHKKLMEEKVVEIRIRECKELHSQ